MMKLQTKLALFNLLSKLVFSALFIGFLPLIIERINTRQTDNELIDKREEIIGLIAEVGIEPFITLGTDEGFGSYNILKEEFISLERVNLTEDWNFIEVTQRLIDNETIDYRVLHYSFRVEGQTYLLEIGKSLASIIYAEKNIRKVILIFLAIFIAVTLLSDLFYTARILRPLRGNKEAKSKEARSLFLIKPEPLLISAIPRVWSSSSLRVSSPTIGGIFSDSRTSFSSGSQKITVSFPFKVNW